MRAFRLFLATTLLAAAILAPASADSTLSILPISESQIGRSWAAVGEMIMRYYSVPNTGPDDDYQCGLANFLSGGEGCGAPGKLSAFNAALEVIDGYQPYAFAHFDEPPRQMRWQQGGVMAPADLIHEIELERPLAAAITPPQMSAVDVDAEQVALIVGYQGGAGSLLLLVNDPRTYAFGADPFVDVGAQLLEPGQYLIPYESFVRDLRWKATIHHIKPE